jgi:lysophospholipase L1-like esterase
LAARRLARLGATPDFHHGLLAAGLFLTVLTCACGSSAPPTGPGPIVTPPPIVVPTPPTPPVTPPALAITRILSFGDSMTEGTTQPSYAPFTLTAGKPESYPFKLQTLLAARYTAQTVAVSNAGRAGENAAAVSPSARSRLSGALSEARPELVILMEGANDLNTLDSVGSTDVSPVVGALEDMVRDAIGRGAQVMVATLPPQRTNSQRGNAGSRLPKYNNELKLMAAKKGAMLVDVNALLPLSFIGQDGLHPTEAGYDAIAQIFLDAIKAKYEVPAAQTTSARR